MGLSLLQYVNDVSVTSRWLERVAQIFTCFFTWRSGLGY
jgi:hypothetical protein